MKKNYQILLLTLIICLIPAFFYAQENNYKALDEIASEWPDGDYPCRVSQGNMMMPMGKKPIQFHKDGDGKVTAITVFDHQYESSASYNSSFVKAFNYRNYSLYVTPTTIVKYSFRGSDNEITPEAMWGKKMGVGKAKKEIRTYLDYANNYIEEQKEEYSTNVREENERKAKERKEKYSLEGKDVSKIEIINLNIPEYFGHFRGFSFDMMATLADGYQISTKGYEMGFIEEYQITYDQYNYNGSQLVSGFVDGDIITFNISSSYAPALSVSGRAVLKYNENIEFNYNGLSTNIGAGGHAHDFRIEVKTIKHAVSGEDLNAVRIVDVTEGNTVVKEFKIGVDQTVHLYCNGGNGGREDAYGGGSSGGDGGDITVIKDPTVKQFYLNYSNKGGRTGVISLTDDDGRDGRYKEEVRSVHF